MDPGRDVIAVAYRRDSEDVIEMPMREQHRYRVKPVLAQQVVQWLLGTLSRVDHDARTTSLMGEQETVRLKRPRGEASDEHRSSVGNARRGG
jgi:hypothetical protein